MRGVFQFQNALFQTGQGAARLDLRLSPLWKIR
jgi:hypothetical protein